MKKIYTLLAYVSLIIITGCTSDSISDLEATEVIEVVTFNDNIQPIISNNCLPCHNNPPSPGVPISLTTFEEVRTSTQINLIDRISLQPGQGGFMPQGGSRLPQGLIDLIIQWRDQGFIEGE